MEGWDDRAYVEGPDGRRISKLYPSREAAEEAPENRSVGMVATPDVALVQGG